MSKQPGKSQSQDLQRQEGLLELVIFFQGIVLSQRNE